MHEIKFRGKRKDNGKLAYGSLVRGLEVDDDNVDWWIFEDTTVHIARINQYQYIVDPETIGQYVPSENFYESDVLYGQETDDYGNLMSEWWGIVKYDESVGRIRIKDDCGEWCETNDFLYDEIIGNIHDNPELLKLIEHEIE